MKQRLRSNKWRGVSRSLLVRHNRELNGPIVGRRIGRRGGFRDRNHMSSLPLKKDLHDP